MTNLGVNFASVLSVWSVVSPKERERPQPLTENSVVEACLGERTALSHPNLLHTCAMILQNGTGEWLDQHSFPWDAEAGSAKLSPEFSSGLKTHEKFRREDSFLRVVSLNYKLTSISQTSKSSKNRAR